MAQSMAAYNSVLPTCNCSSSSRSKVPFFGAVLLGVSAAFLISNASFYFLSGYFPAMSWAEYASRVAKYFPPYASAAVAYIVLAAGLHVLAAYAAPRSQRA